MDSGVMGILVIVYTIAVFVIYHKLVIVIYFGSITRGLLRELGVSFLVGLVLAGITLYFWWLAALIIIAAGFVFSGKVNEPTGKKIIIVAFAVMALLVAIVGIRFEKKIKEDKKYDEFYESLGSEPVNPKIHIVTNDNNYVFDKGKTYVCSGASERVFINAKYSDDMEPSFGYLEFVIIAKGGSQGLYVDTENFRAVNSKEAPLKYYSLDGRQYEMVEVLDENHFILSGGIYDEDGLSGKYSLATDNDIRYLQNNMSDLLKSRIEDYTQEFNESNTITAGFVSEEVDDQIDSALEDEREFQEEFSDGDFYDSGKADDEESLNELNKNEFEVVVTATDGYVNIRNGPGTEYEIIDTARNGETLDVVDGITREDNGKVWFQIMTYWNRGSNYGWVAESQVTSLTNGYILPESDSVKYSKSDLSFLSKEGLRYARNEIIARHGRRYKDEALRRYFNGRSWYHPYRDEIEDSDLNEYENDNIDLIKGLE